MTSGQHPTSLAAPADARRSVAVCALIGAPIMSALDEIVFHQILRWHHFYDRSTLDAGLVSDGLLHSAELVALVAGFFLFSDLRRRRELSVPHGWAGFLIGAAGFQLYDGLIDHKVLNLHEIRYGVDLLPYDLAWNGFGVLLLLGGLLMLRTAERRSGSAST